MAALIPSPSPNFGRREFAGLENFREHQANIGLDFFIPISNEPITELFELARLLFILFVLQVMDVAVNFHHQPFFGAIEIGDERPKWVLAAKF